MSDVLRSELLKVRTTRSFWWTVLIGLGLVVLFVVVILAYDGVTESNVRDALSTPGIVGLLMIILGVVGAGGEYRHGTITSSLLTVPDRLRFLAAKGVAFFLSGAVAALIASAIAFAITIVWASGDGTSLSDLGVGGGDIAEILLGNTAYAAIGAAFGVAVGAIIRNQIAAIVGILILFFVLDPLLAAQFDSYGRYSLSGIADAMDGIDNTGADYEVLSLGVAIAVYAAYTVVLLGACALLDRRRDVAS